MQTTFGVNMVALVDNVPRTLPLQAVIHNYVAHQREVIVRRTKHELSEKEARAHILEGLLIALEHLDAIIELIRASRDRDAAREQLVERFELSHIQATAILDLRLSQLTALEADSIKQEHADVTERIAELRAILGDESRVLAVIKEELTEISERFGSERRTEISHSEDEIDIEDLIADQQMVITITQTGYIKSLPLATYRQQARGGRGVTGMDMKDGDFIEHLFVCSSHDYLLFFSNRGKVYRSKVYELPEASRTAKGRALVNILPLREGERIQAVVSTRDFSETKYLVFATKSGTVKKTEFLAYNTPIKADGIIAINIRDDDELLAVRAVDPDDEIIMVSKAGLTVRFAESDARSMGRDTTGVRGMDVGKKGEVIAMDVARDDMDLLVVTDNGYGKRTQIAQYRKTNRGAKGVKTIGLTERKGGLAGALVVREHQELVFISVGGMVQRTAAGGISQQGRSATGVRVMNLKDEDLVSAVALVVDAGDDASDAGEAVLADPAVELGGWRRRAGRPACRSALSATSLKPSRFSLKPQIRLEVRRQPEGDPGHVQRSSAAVADARQRGARNACNRRALAAPRRRRGTGARAHHRAPMRRLARRRARACASTSAESHRTRTVCHTVTRKIKTPAHRVPAASRVTASATTVAATQAQTIAEVLATPCQNTQLMPQASNLPLIRASVLCLINTERAAARQGTAAEQHEPRTRRRKPRQGNARARLLRSHRPLRPHAGRTHPRNRLRPELRSRLRARREPRLGHALAGDARSDRQRVDRLAGAPREHPRRPATAKPASTSSRRRPNRSPKASKARCTRKSSASSSTSAASHPLPLVTSVRYPDRTRERRWSVR